MERKQRTGAYVVLAIATFFAIINWWYYWSSYYVGYLMPILTIGIFAAAATWVELWYWKGSKYQKPAGIWAIVFGVLATWSIIGGILAIVGGVMILKTKVVDASTANPIGPNNQTITGQANGKKFYEDEINRLSAEIKSTESLIKTLKEHNTEGEPTAAITNAEKKLATLKIQLRANIDLLNAEHH